MSGGSKDLQRVAVDMTRSLLRHTAIHFVKTMPEIDVRFDLRGQAAGMAVFPAKGKPYIRYNLQLLELNRQDFLERTVPHEVAHIAAHVIYGTAIRPHGAEWAALMKLYGAESTRCHRYDTSQTSTRKLRRYTYRCSCREHQLTSIRHNRVVKGMRYLCRSCGEKLSFRGGG